MAHEGLLVDETKSPRGSVETRTPSKSQSLVEIIILISHYPPAAVMIIVEGVKPYSTCPLANLSTSTNLLHLIGSASQGTVVQFD
jgi:hypothetical protein